MSRIALESAVYTSGCILVGDEILAVNLVDVTRMSLDDVVIIMSIPRRLVLTTRRKKSAPNRFGPNRNVEHKPTPVVVFKGDPADQHHQSEFAFRSDIRQLGGGSAPQDGPFLSPSRHRENSQFRDSRTLTWDRNPKPDRNDPKYFPINSLPRQRVSNTGATSSPREPGWSQYDGGRERDRDLMPPPMHALPSYQPPPPVVTEQPRLSKEPTHFKPYKHPYSAATQPANGKNQALGEKLNQANFPENDFYSENSETYNNDSGKIWLQFTSHISPPTSLQCGPNRSLCLC